MKLSIIASLLVKMLK